MGLEQWADLEQLAALETLEGSHFHHFSTLPLVRHRLERQSTFYLSSGKQQPQARQILLVRKKACLPHTF